MSKKGKKAKSKAKVKPLVKEQTKLQKLEERLHNAIEINQCVLSVFSIHEILDHLIADSEREVEWLDDEIDCMPGWKELMGGSKKAMEDQTKYFKGKREAYGKMLSLLKQTSEQWTKIDEMRCP